MIFFWIPAFAGMTTSCMFHVIPAKAGIQDYLDKNFSFYWIPASAGMTKKSRDDTIKRILAE